MNRPYHIALATLFDVMPRYSYIIVGVGQVISYDHCNITGFYSMTGFIVFVTVIYKRTTNRCSLGVYWTFQYSFNTLIDTDVC